MDILIPDAFRKVSLSRLSLDLRTPCSFQLQCSHHVNNWGVEVLLGVFDMVELLIDLIAARLASSPVPVQLLETLSILFDYDSVFHRKHRSKSYDRSLYDKQLGDRVLAHSPSSTYTVYNRSEPYGWLCQIINRFVLKDGVQNLKNQFQSEQPLTAVVSIAMSLSCSHRCSLLGIQRPSRSLYQLYGLPEQGEIPTVVSRTRRTSLGLCGELEGRRFQSKGSFVLREEREGC